MKNFIRSSFRRELLFNFMLVTMVPLLLCSVIMIQSFKTKIQSDYEKEATSQSEEAVHSIASVMDELDAMSIAISTNENILKSLYLKDTEERKSIYMELYDMTFELRQYAQISLYSIGGVCKYSTDNKYYEVKLPTYWGILKEAADNQGKTVIRDVESYSNEKQASLLKMARIIMDDNGNCIGYIVIDMNQSQIERMLDGTYNTLNDVIIVDNYWHCIYTTESDDKVSIAPILREHLLRVGNISNIEKDSEFYVTPIGDTGLFFVLEQREVFTDDITRTMYGVGLLVAALSMMLCVAVAIQMSHHLTKPVDRLARAMHEVENGNLDVQIETSRVDELGRLSRNFNVMTKELNDYMEKQVSQQKELNNANIAMMQAQLNPHFIYNTLDTVKWVAKANHIPEIGTLSANLAKILRTSISGEHFIALKDEMALVKYYIDIQRIRFSDKFEYELNLPEELEECIVPKLILQPLVENAIIHGLAESEGGYIGICVKKEQEELHIVVSDNGCGITDEVLEHLNSHDRTQLIGHIGFYNVDTIIRLYYGNEYGICAKKVEEGGTKILIKLPIRWEMPDA